jgi:hypothetical protein
VALEEAVERFERLVGLDALDVREQRDLFVDDRAAVFGRAEEFEERRSRA